MRCPIRLGGWSAKAWPTLFPKNFPAASADAEAPAICIAANQSAPRPSAGDKRPSGSGVGRRFRLTADVDRRTLLHTPRA
jgi:hypothetical protein